MAVVWTTIRDTPGGAFSSYTQTEIEDAIAQAGRRIDSTYWGALEDDGVRYLASHLLAVQDPGNAAAGGSVKRQRAGPLEKEFQAIAWSGDWYNVTPYGREYKAIQMGLRYKASPRAI